MEVTVTLIDQESNESFDIRLSAEEAERVKNDTFFATTLMESLRKEAHADVVKQKAKDAEGEFEDDETTTLFRWSYAAVTLLISTYSDMDTRFKKGKVSHKKLWEEISEILQENGHNISGPQSASKMRSLRKVYKSIKDHNSKSGNDRRTWAHFEAMDELFHKTAWSEPIAVASSSGLSRKREEDSSSGMEAVDEQHISKKSKKSDIAVLLKERLEQKEKHEAFRQKRHAEKMKIDTELLALLNKLTSKS